MPEIMEVHRRGGLLFSTIWAEEIQQIALVQEPILQAIADPVWSSI